MLGSNLPLLENFVKSGNTFVSSDSKTILRVISLWLTTAVGLGGAYTAMAQSLEHSDSNKSKWGLGIGAMSKQKAFTDIDRDTKLLPFISYENEYIKWFGDSLDIKLPSIEVSNTQKVNFSITAGYDFGAYDKDDIKDTPLLNGMHERDDVVKAGARMEWKNPWADVNAQWMTDVSGDREGNDFSLGFERNWMLGQHVMLTPHVKISWLDDKYVDYQYGVRADEARIDRPVYIGESTVNIEYGLRGLYLFDENQSILLDMSVTSLGNEIKDSPLVDSSTENSIMFFYLYSF